MTPLQLHKCLQKLYLSAKRRDGTFYDKKIARATVHRTAHEFFCPTFVSILPQIELLFGPLVVQLVWYILKQLFTSVSVKVVDIYLHFGE